MFDIRGKHPLSTKMMSHRLDEESSDDEVIRLMRQSNKFDESCSYEVFHQPTNSSFKEDFEIPSIWNDLKNHGTYDSISRPHPTSITFMTSSIFTNTTQNTAQVNSSSPDFIFDNILSPTHPSSLLQHQRSEDLSDEFNSQKQYAYFSSVNDPSLFDSQHISQLIHNQNSVYPSSFQESPTNSSNNVWNESSKRRQNVASDYYPSQLSAPGYNRLPGNNFAEVAKGEYVEIPQPTERLQFELQLEDFPVLPSSQDSSKCANPNCITDTKKRFKTSTSVKNEEIYDYHVQADNDDASLTDFDRLYGMLGLKRYSSNNDSKLSYTEQLFHGVDLSTIGIKLNTSKAVYPQFISPLLNRLARPHELDISSFLACNNYPPEFNFPKEYQIYSLIYNRLSPIDMSLYEEDLLMFIYYAFHGGILQQLASTELYKRDWKYHKKYKLWLTRVPNHDLSSKTQTSEFGIYYVFDVQNWRKITQEMEIEYSQLESQMSCQCDRLQQNNDDKSADSDEKSESSGKLGCSLTSHDDDPAYSHQFGVCTAATSKERDRRRLFFRIDTFDINSLKLRNPLIPPTRSLNLCQRT